MVYSEGLNLKDSSNAEKLAWELLNKEAVQKIPILLLLTLPILIFLMLFLLLFGQKPDSFIRAFTDTYFRSFSQLSHDCDNVDCGNHFLCSVAANGHQSVVKPHRLGERGGKPIICNRQLLISNAFEELIQEKLPKTHRFIRKNYNKVGNFVHRYYGIFNNKFVADAIYFMMKPLEYFFVLTLYTFDTKPENRIAKQYVSKEIRRSMEKIDL